ncbi:MAG: adenosylcobinamide-GDP ribazoletransferase [Acidimicrobiia bacterium]|nr:adenosylcobinamide-GDP ribazoletransferase [Acidimicrobiia bacterium]
MGPAAVSGLRAAVAFLTRVPAGAGDERVDVGRAVPWFPVVGGLVGLLVAAVYAAGRQLVAPLPAAAVAVGCGVVVTGAFHEDGLADTADAFGARDPADARRILKDPSHGTYGVCAIVLSLVTRTAAVASLGGWAAMAVLPAANALARAAALLLLGVVPVATDEGLGASYAAGVGAPQLVAVALVGAVVAGLFLGAWVGPAAALAMAGAFCFGFVGSKPGHGLTGDVLGAAEQGAEVGVLLLGALVVGQGWAGLPWWR